MHKRNFTGPNQSLRSAAATAVQRQPYGPVRHEITKRGIDIVVALTTITFVLPLLLICAGSVWLVSGRGPFVPGACVGQYGRKFWLLNFPTGEETTISKQISPTRKNQVGRLLAISNLDRLPELFNLLHGDISLVGPRPLSIDDHQYYSTRIPGYAHRAQVKPGLLGWAQLHEREYPMDIPRQIQLDIWYVHNQTLRLDLKIFWLSLQQTILGRD